MSNPLDANGVEALEPCPFCGAAFLIAQEPHDNHPVAGKFYIFHDYGPIGSAARSCVVDVSRHFDSREEAIALWNRRAPLAPSHTAVEPVAWVVQLLYDKERDRWSGDMLTDVLPSDTDTYRVIRPLYDASTLTAQAAALVAAERERDEARQIVRDIYWMAVRYADGRKSYAPGMCNDALRKAYDAGWLVYRDDKQHDLDPQYARDGDRPEYRSVEARAEAAESEAATLKARIAELEAGLANETEACAKVADIEIDDANALSDMHSAYGTLTDMVRARIAGRRDAARAIAFNTRARRLTHQEKNNAG